MADLIHQVQSSNLARHHKDSLVERMMSHLRMSGSHSPTAMLRKLGDHGGALADSFVNTSEGLAAGAVLGAVHATMGLDTTIKGHTVPMDFIGSLLLQGLSIGFPNAARSKDASVIGSQVGAVFSFRKIYDYVATKRKAAGSPVGGTFAGEGSDWTVGFGMDSVDQELLKLSNALK